MGFLSDLISELSGRRVCRCIICGCRTGEARYKADGAGICGACFERLEFTPKPHAYGAHPPAEVLYAPLYYRGGTVRSVTDMKFRDCRANAKVIAALLLSECGEGVERADIILPVPTSDERYRERGFNQAELIAEELCALSGKEYVYEAAVKLNDTPHQVKLSSDERIRNTGALYAVSSEYVFGKNVLAVDDVYTTGTTVSVFASALLKAGAKSVSAMTAAHSRASRGSGKALIMKRREQAMSQLERAGHIKNNIS